MQDRVCFFSEYDLSVGYHLELAEKRVIEIANDNIPQDLEGIIELWHIRRFIESDCKLLRYHMKCILNKYTGINWLILH